MTFLKQSDQLDFSHPSLLLSTVNGFKIESKTGRKFLQAVSSSLQTVLSCICSRIKTEVSEVSPSAMKEKKRHLLKGK